jgi:protein involved in polysaccharide export with SLBB domain
MPINSHEGWRGSATRAAFAFRSIDLRGNPMSRFVHGRRWWAIAPVALALLAAAPLHAETTESTVTDMLESRLPGHQATESLKRILSVPDAATRWRGLPSFGRELFRTAAERYAAVEDGPVGPGYVLGPGDQLTVFVSSLADTSITLMLDREGKVFLPRVGATFLWGLTFSDAEALIKNRVGSVLKNAHTHVSMGRLRAADVFVLGSVARPGKYTVTGLATAFNALSAAGGPDSLGSMRNIRVLRANREVGRLDLYRFLLSGDRSNDVPLQSGDVVFVGFEMAQIGIQGAVVRPAVYESDGPVTLRALLAMAGGASPFADLARIHIERLDANGGFRLQDLPLDHGHGIDPDSLTLSDFDLVTVLPIRDRMRNVVTLDGFVRHPGEYELTEGMKLSTLAAADRLLPEASLEAGELRRIDPKTFHVEVRPVSLRRAWAGTEDVVLQPLDAVTIFSSARLPRSVRLEGEVMRPGDYTIGSSEHLSDVLQRAGGATTNGYLPAAVFMRKSAADQQRTTMHKFLDRQRLAIAQERVQVAQSGDTIAAQELMRAESSLANEIEAQNNPGRVVLNLDQDGKWIKSAKDPLLEDGDHLIVPLRPATVTVIGSVMNPGTVMARRNASFSDYVKLVGGASRQADLGSSYVIRASGEAVPRRAASRIEAGDAIIVPPRQASGTSLGRSLVGGWHFLIEAATAAALVMVASKR